jgi:hypothetical protein
MTSFLTSLGLLIAVVGFLLAFVFWKERRRRGALHESEEVR